MSSSATGGDALGCVGDEASPSMSPSMEVVLPIRGVDGNTGEAIPIDAALSLREAGDPFRADVVRILRAYGLAPTQVAPNGWSQMEGGMYLWFRHSFGMEMPLHVFQTIYQSRKLLKNKDTLPRCELSRDVIDIVRSIYQAAPLTWSYGLILNIHRCLVELSFMASKAEMDQGRRPHPTLARLTKQRLKVLVPDSTEDTSQRKVIEDLSREENKAEVFAPNEDSGVPEGEATLKRKRKGGASRTLSVNPSGEVVLDSPPRVDPVSGGSGVGPFDSRKRLRELIGPPGSRISDDALKNVPFFPSMGAQAVKKYFTPKWEEFASHGDLEDVLEAGLDATVRATSL
ncbi:hypothetical protein Adt_44804 [Abeliophyllum distichum]|uniref:Uncharacterized protein n=1 Tax=Abeliophyllum distichum TaxID=126358 RepID=A0ABD1PCM2_9LAMI